MKVKISVILPVYNSANYLRESILSVLSQTFVDFELIIINDGSNDDSLNIIQDFIRKDNRIKLISRGNKGLVASLNEGIKHAQGDYIARMDADDICLPTRLEDQISYMNKHNLDLCGSWVEQFSDDGNLTIRKYPIKHEDILVSLLFYNPFAHPSVMIKSTVFELVSYENEVSEDYRLWCDILLKGFKVGNTPKVLLRYRKHDQQITNNKNAELLASGRKISESFANILGILEQSIVEDKISFIYHKQRQKYLEISNNIDLLILKHGASQNVKYEILLFLYLKSYPKSPWLYYKYSVLTYSYKKNLDDELLLFIKSFCYFNNDSKLFYKIKRIYNKYKKIK